MHIEKIVTGLDKVTSVDDVKAVLNAIFELSVGPRMLYEHLRDQVAIRIYAESNGYGIQQVVAAWLPFAKTYRLVIKPSVWSLIEETSKHQLQAPSSMTAVMPGIFSAMAATATTHANEAVETEFEKILRSY